MYFLLFSITRSVCAETSCTYLVAICKSAWPRTLWTRIYNPIFAKIFFQLCVFRSESDIHYPPNLWDLTSVETKRRQGNKGKIVWIKRGYLRIWKIAALKNPSSPETPCSDMLISYTNYYVKVNFYLVLFIYTLLFCAGQFALHSYILHLLQYLWRGLLFVPDGERPKVDELKMLSVPDEQGLSPAPSNTSDDS